MRIFFEDSEPARSTKSVEPTHPTRTASIPVFSVHLLLLRRTSRAITHPAPPPSRPAPQPVLCRRSFPAASPGAPPPVKVGVEDRQRCGCSLCGWWLFSFLLFRCRCCHLCVSSLFFLLHDSKQQRPLLFFFVDTCSFRMQASSQSQKKKAPAAPSLLPHQSVARHLSFPLFCFYYQTITAEQANQQARCRRRSRPRGASHIWKGREAVI